MRSLIFRAGRLGAEAIGLAAAALLLGSALARAGEDVPDIQGPWTGKSFTIVAGASTHWPNNTGTYETPFRGEKDMVINVTHQEGRRFWGTKTLSNDHEKTVEPFIGELYGPGARKVLIAYTVGVGEGEINGDVLSHCFAQADGRGPTKSSVVSCTELHHAR